MNRIILAVTLCLGMFGLIGSGIWCAEETAKELKQLEGVWVSTPAKKGRDRGHMLVFQGGRMLWRSFQTQDGEPVIGHDKLYEIRVDPQAAPCQITATRGEGTDRETRRGIYKLDGDTLKVAFSMGRDGERPKKFEDESTEVITLTRDKKAKVPDLSKTDKKRGKETPIAPAMKWLGQLCNATVLEQCPQKPITTGAEFEKVWKLLRGAEAVPKVDFTKEFVLVRASTVGRVTTFGLRIFEGDDEASESISETLNVGETMVGFSYAICVFRREQVDVVDGRIVVKGSKK